MKRSVPSKPAAKPARRASQEPAVSAQLADALVTQQDRWEFSQTLDQAKQLLYLKNTTPESLLEQLRHDHAQILGQACGQLFSNPTLTELQEVITLLEKTTTRFPVITLTLTYHPTKAQIRELVTFLRLKLGTTLLLDLKFDPNLVGGTVIQFNGQSIDLSLRETLQNAKF